jgi:hypothetical protein
MPEWFPCAACETRVQVPENLLGGKVKCPACGGSVATTPDILDVVRVEPEIPDVPEVIPVEEPLLRALSLELQAIALSPEELKADLPWACGVCMCCGAPAVAKRTKRFFTLNPARAGIFPFGIAEQVVLSTVRAATDAKHELRAPFCARHADHWEKRSLGMMTAAAMLLLFALGVPVGLFLFLFGGPITVIVGAPIAVACLFVGGFVTKWALANHISQFLVHPGYLCLSNVSKEFCDALQHRRKQRAMSSHPIIVRDPVKSDSIVVSPEMLTRAQRMAERQEWRVAFVTPIFALILVIGLGIVIVVQGNVTDREWLLSPVIEVKK